MLFGPRRCTQKGLIAALKKPQFQMLRELEAAGKTDRLWHGDCDPFMCPSFRRQPGRGHILAIRTDNRTGKHSKNQGCGCANSVPGRLCDNPTRILTGGEVQRDNRNILVLLRP
jgi:hypothetical protein